MNNDSKRNDKAGNIGCRAGIVSAQGYEATSISQLTEVAGIRKASLCSHFENKQAILNALIQTAIGECKKHSIFANADWDNPALGPGAGAGE